jgi:hypothetical protein
MITKRQYQYIRYNQMHRYKRELVSDFHVTLIIVLLCGTILTTLFTLRGFLL